MSEQESDLSPEPENELRAERMPARAKRARKNRERPGKGVYPADMRPAGFWIRFGARFIDGVVFRVVFFLLEVALGAVVGADLAALLLFPVYLLSLFLYETLMTASKWQATLGKRALSIKVVTRGGERLAYLHSVGRFFAVSLSYLTLIIGFIMAAFMTRKEALHDLAASTYVVHGGRGGNRPARNRRGVKVKSTDSAGAPGQSS